MIQTNDIPVVELPDKADTGTQAWDALKGLSFDDAITKIANSIVDFSFRLLIAILIFYVGRFVIRRLYNTVRNIMLSRHMEPSLITFVLSLVKILLYFILVITIVGILGIETSSFLALFASAGVAVGLALSGTLQNFAGGVLLLILKPYKVGDFIEASGYTGTVKEIQIFNTVLNTTDNKAIIIPNGGLSTSAINNYSLEDYRRVDWNIGLCYGIDYEKARQVILEMLNSDPRVVKTTIDEDKVIRRKARETTEGMADTDNNVKSDASSDSDDETADKLETSAPVRESWWRRFRASRRAHQMVVQEKLRQKEALNAGVIKPANVKPFVALGELADSSVNLVIRAWTPSSEYWGLFYDMNARFYKELPEHGFDFPFPQMDVHLSKE